MQTMLEVVLTVQLPVLADHDPPATIPSLQEAQAIEVTANTLGFTIEPTSRFVVMVTLVQGPVRANVSPMIVPESTQNAPTVAV